MRVAPSVRKPVWIAGFVVAVVATSGLAVIARSIPVSYASASGGGAGFGEATVPGATTHAQDRPAADPATSSAAKRPACAECGVVQSVRRIPGSGDSRTREGGDGRTAGLVAGLSGGAIDAGAPAQAGHEITIRHRDGTTSVFIETSSPIWRPGIRVILIPGVMTASK